MWDWPSRRSGSIDEAMDLQLQIRPFRFALIQPLRTAAGVLRERSGWLLRLESRGGRIGWGEVSPLDQALLPRCRRELETLPSPLTRETLEPLLPRLSGAIGFGLGGALAELDGLVGDRARRGWLMAPQGAELLPAGGLMLPHLDRLLEQRGRRRALTLKWKVAAEADGLERRWLEQLMERLPSTARLRLDANGGWDRTTALAWMRSLVGDARFAWLEQPLPPDDRDGLESLAEQGPVALDESLMRDPRLRETWPGWQVRRPAVADHVVALALGHASFGVRPVRQILAARRRSAARSELFNEPDADPSEAGLLAHRLKAHGIVARGWHEA